MKVSPRLKPQTTRLPRCELAQMPPGNRTLQVTELLSSNPGLGRLHYQLVISCLRVKEWKDRFKCGAWNAPHGLLARAQKEVARLALLNLQKLKKKRGENDEATSKCPLGWPFRLLGVFSFFRMRSATVRRGFASATAHQCSKTLCRWLSRAKATRRVSLDVAWCCLDRSPCTWTCDVTLAQEKGVLK